MINWKLFNQMIVEIMTLPLKSYQVLAVYQELHMSELIYSSLWAYKINTSISPFLQMRKHQS